MAMADLGEWIVIDDNQETHDANRRTLKRLRVLRGMMQLYAEARVPMPDPLRDLIEQVKANHLEGTDTIPKRKWEGIMQSARQALREMQRAI